MVRMDEKPRWTVQCSRNQRLLRGPTVFRDPNLPPRPGGIIILGENYKGRSVVIFSTVPLAPKRTRGPNKCRRDRELLSSDEELDTTSSRLSSRSLSPREAAKRRKKEAADKKKREEKRKNKISKTKLEKSGSTKAMTPAERKKKQRDKEKGTLKEGEELKNNRLRNQVKRDGKKKQDSHPELCFALIDTRRSESADMSG